MISISQSIAGKGSISVPAHEVKHYGRLKWSLVNSSAKIWLYKAIVLSVVTYESDRLTWKMTEKVTETKMYSNVLYCINLATTIDASSLFHRRCLRKLLRITYLDHITNKIVLKRA